MILAITLTDTANLRTPYYHTDHDTADRLDSTRAGMVLAGAGADGELTGKVLTIEGFLGRDAPWSTIEAATGIDEAAFRRLKHQVEAADDATPHPD